MPEATALRGNGLRCDRKYDVIAMISSAGNIMERVRYSAYGVARHQPSGDVTGDGVVDATDLTSLLSNWNKTLGAPGSTYRAEIDFNRDGTISAADQSTLLSNWGAAQPEGVLSTLGNTVGYAGYLYDQATNMSLARFRWYDATAGLWATRDPLTAVTKSWLGTFLRSRSFSTPGAPYPSSKEIGKAWRFWLEYVSPSLTNLHQYVSARPLDENDSTGLGPLNYIRHFFGPEGPLFRQKIPAHIPGGPVERGLINGGSRRFGRYLRFGRGFNERAGKVVWRIGGILVPSGHIDLIGWTRVGAVGCAAAGGYLVGDQIAEHTGIDESIGDFLADLCPDCWDWVPMWMD